MLDGKLSNGTVIRRIRTCEFDGGPRGPYGQIDACDGDARYSVTFTDGCVMNACEECAQRLWDRFEQPQADPARVQSDESAQGIGSATLERSSVIPPRAGVRR